jgi:hypothetical protein
MATTSLREQLLSQLKVLLTGVSPTVGGNVFRDREVSITRAVEPAIVIMPNSNSMNRMATQVDRNGLSVDLEIFVRGDPWTQLADPIDVAMHAAIMNDATLRTIASDVRREGESFEGVEADLTAGTLTVTYRFTYLTNASDITRAG